MKVIAKPKNEWEIRESVDKETSKERIVKGMITKAECCVDHLCGCK
jgi:hypothetical protein